MKHLRVTAALEYEVDVPDNVQIETLQDEVKISAEWPNPKIAVTNLKYLMFAPEEVTPDHETPGPGALEGGLPGKNGAPTTMDLMRSLLRN